MPKLLERFQHAWNVFMAREPTGRNYYLGETSFNRPDRVVLTGGNERSIVTTIINRIAVDASNIPIKHVRLDDNKRYLEDMDSRLNECLTVSANDDQTGSDLRRNMAMTVMDSGVMAIVPEELTNSPVNSNSFDIVSLRVGTITEWRPKEVKVKCYVAQTGRIEEYVLPKKMVGIVENPFYAIMNERNSTAQRLNRKLALLDISDEKVNSGKLDMIVQLPFSLRNDLQREKAETRKKEIEMQLAGSKYGIAYIDAAEKITQLNRPVENNLMNQVEYLTSMLYSQLGMTTGILDGTADEQTMNNYLSRTVGPIVTAIVDEMRRKFLTKTARTKGQDIRFFSDPFQLVPATQVAEMADKLTRNEILTTNEFRQILGMKPSLDPRADELRNKNLSESNEQVHYDIDGNPINETNGGTDQNGEET